MKDFFLPHVEPGRIRTSTGWSYERLVKHPFDKREDLVIPYLMKFDEGIGVFRQNMKQSFNPFYWIEFIILLPEKIIKYVYSEPLDAFM